jgi:hypothetical protein
MQMHMLVVISKLMREKQPICTTLHLIFRHEKLNLHIICTSTITQQKQDHKESDH